MPIRLARHNDIHTLITARFDYFKTEGWFLSDQEQAAFTLKLQEYYTQHLAHDFFAALVEDDGGCLLATAFLVISEKPANPSWPTGKTGTILNVLTYPEHRRRGYAGMAMTLLLDTAKKRDLSYLELSASEMGRPLYEKLGFREQHPTNHTEMRLGLL